MDLLYKLYLWTQSDGFIGLLFLIGFGAFAFWVEAASDLKRATKQLKKNFPLAKWDSAEIESEDLYAGRGGSVDVDGQRLSIYLQKGNRIQRGVSKHFLTVEARLPAVSCPIVSIRKKGLITFFLWMIGRRISLSATEKIYPKGWALTSCPETARQRGELVDPKFLALVDLLVAQGWRQIDFTPYVLRLQKPMRHYSRLPTSAEFSAVLKACAACAS